MQLHKVHIQAMQWPNIQHEAYTKQFAASKLLLEANVGNIMPMQWPKTVA